MWPRLSHTLAPLARMRYNKVKFKWTKIGQYDFGGNNRILDYDTLLTYPDFNE